MSKQRAGPARGARVEVDGWEISFQVPRGWVRGGSPRAASDAVQFYDRPTQPTQVIVVRMAPAADEPLARLAETELADNYYSGLRVLAFDPERMPRYRVASDGFDAACIADAGQGVIVCAGAATRPPRSRATRSAYSFSLQTSPPLSQRDVRVMLSVVESVAVLAPR